MRITRACVRGKLQTAPAALVAQAGPAKPEAHVHENPLPCNTRRELPPIAAAASTQVPPLRHGRDTHAEPGAQRSHVFAQYTLDSAACEWQKPLVFTDRHGCCRPSVPCLPPWISMRVSPASLSLHGALVGCFVVGVVVGKIVGCFVGTRVGYCVGAARETGGGEGVRGQQKRKRKHTAGLDPSRAPARRQAIALN